MSKRDNNTNKLKDLIPQMLQENKLQKGMDQIYVKEAWAEVMGKGVANYTETVSMKNQTIFVKLSSAALREELQYGQDKIVKMMDDALGKIKVSSIKWM